MEERQKFRKTTKPTTMSFKEISGTLFDKGLYTFPIGTGKVPIVAEWQKADTWPKDQLQNNFNKPHEKIGLLAGINGLEILDFDQKAYLKGDLFKDFIAVLFDMYPRWKERMKEMYIQETVNKGKHLLYFCPETTIPGNSVYAKREPSVSELKENPKTQPPALIETRGKGGQALIAPSPGYKVLRGDILNLPTLSPDERYELIDAARFMNEYFPAPPLPKVREFENNGLTPWEDYNQKQDLVALLEQNGYRQVKPFGKKRIYMKRPGVSDSPNSGNILSDREVPLWYVWSSSTELPSGAAYTPWSVYACMEHGGDFSMAAKELYRLGYGDRFKKPEAVSDPPVKKASFLDIDPDEEEEIPDFIKDVELEEFDYHKKYEPLIASFEIGYDDRIYPLSADDGQIWVVGKQKSRKSALVRLFVAAALKRGILENVCFDIGEKMILYFDTEQSPRKVFPATIRKIMQQAGFEDNSPRFRAFPLRKYKASARVKVIDYYVRLYQENLGLLIIDGAKDLMGDYNSGTEATSIIEQILRWQGLTGCISINVLHLNKNDNNLRGTLGTEAQNKGDLIMEVISRKEEPNKIEISYRDVRNWMAPPNMIFHVNERNMIISDALPAMPVEAPVITKSTLMNDEDIPF